MKLIIPLLVSSLLLQGCSLFMGEDEDYSKRTFGTRLNDQRVESYAIKNIRDANPQLDEAHVDVTSFNGTVLLTGQVPSEKLKKMAVESIEGIRHIKTIHNELQVAGPTSLIARTNDNWLKTKVKSALGFSDEARASRIKVVVENGVVYLMGLLTRNEADSAVNVVQDVYGVQKIVKVFEYID
ncbi:MAG: BON domain-containing protein [Pseudomonadales bacterium]